ncbi:MAG: helix-turn-helix transcriptional regulator [Planctomycetes bacterium]|nr:helix-turn-helix transcriptional regulator [Planctomycetota bacterium]
MKLSFRLEELCLAQHQKKHGLIQRIAAKTNLKRQQVADLLHNRTKYLSMETLGKICDYLVTECGIKPEQLPGVLFDRAAEDFWHLLDDCNKLTLCLGMRRIDEEPMITHADADLQTAFLYCVSSLTVGKPSYTLDHFLVAAPTVSGEVAERAKVEKLYTEFISGGSRALVAFGSNKINPVAERIMAGCFGADPFAFDVVARPGMRRAPVVLSYRDIDPKVKSCCGDTQLCRGKGFKKPGIYYEKNGNEWDWVPWVRDKRDAAFVLFDQHSGRVQMILAGFSARASRCLANMLNEPEQFWPPSYTSAGRQVGIFIVEFRFKDKHDTRPEANVIRLEEEVIARRLEKP